MYVVGVCLHGNNINVDTGEYTNTHAWAYSYIYFHLYLYVCAHTRITLQWAYTPQPHIHYRRRAVRYTYFFLRLTRCLRAFSASTYCAFLSYSFIFRSTWTLWMHVCMVCIRVCTRVCVCVCAFLSTHARTRIKLGTYFSLRPWLR